jgi:hypothetical protein
MLIFGWSQVSSRPLFGPFLSANRGIKRNLQTAVILSSSDSRRTKPEWFQTMKTHTRTHIFAPWMNILLAVTRQRAGRQRETFWQPTPHNQANPQCMHPIRFPAPMDAIPITSSFDLCCLLCAIPAAAILRIYHTRAIPSAPISSLSPSHHIKYVKRYMFEILNIGKQIN